MKRANPIRYLSPKAFEKLLHQLVHGLILGIVMTIGIELNLIANSGSKYI